MYISIDFNHDHTRASLASYPPETRNQIASNCKKKDKYYSVQCSRLIYKYISRKKENGNGQEK